MGVLDLANTMFFKNDSWNSSCVFHGLHAQLNPSQKPLGSTALRIYPPGFGKYLRRLFPRFINERVVGWRISEEVLGKDLKSYFASLAWGDLWEDAGMVSCLAYIRGSYHLRINEWRDVFPTEL